MAFDDQPQTRPASIKPTTHFQISDLSARLPLAKLSNNNGVHVVGSESNAKSLNMNPLDGKVFATTWRPLVGTELLFDDYGDHVGTITEHLAYAEHIKVNQKEEPKPPKAETDKDAEEEPSKETQNQFMRKALKYARQRQAHAGSAPEPKKGSK